MARTAAKAVLAIEVRAEQMCAVVIDHNDVTHYQGNVPAPTGDDLGAVESITAFARESAQHSRRLALVGCAVVVPGAVDSAAGSVRYSARFGWHNVALAELVAAEVGAPVVLEQDVRAAALAESAAGAADGAQDWLYVSVGPEITAAAVVGGQMQRGSDGAAGEFGHLPIYPFGDLCGCGQRGCVEAYASTIALAERYRRISGTSLDAVAIAGLVGRDPLADEVWRHAIDALALALVTYTMVAAPERVVLGGHFAALADTALPLLRARLRERLLWRQPPQLLAAALGAEAALTGAVTLARAAAELA